MTTLFDSEDGKVTLYASRYDQRFSYYVYIPSKYKLTEEKYPLTVVVHGTERSAEKYRDNFIDYAEKTNSFIIAPLFPSGIIDANDIHSYKFLKFYNIRFDIVLLEMIKEVGEKYNLDTEKFYLFGFSGGGHFSHRFYYLHPERLHAVSIGAPGRITFLDKNQKWYNGIQDIKNIFDKEVDLEELRKVKVQLIVGSDDIDTSMINNPDDPTFNKEAGKYGETRVERLRALHENLLEHEINAIYTEVSGVGHEGLKVTESVKQFFSSILNSERREVL